MFIRGRYGHGGRVGYDKEWRADPLRSGGGELIDQGVHLIDLSRWFLGDFVSVTGFAHTYFWQMPVDDNAFLILHTRQQQTAFLHVSSTEWKNLFSLEIYGRTAKLQLRFMEDKKTGLHKFPDSYSQTSALEYYAQSFEAYHTRWRDDKWQSYDKNAHHDWLRDNNPQMYQQIQEDLGAIARK